MLLLKIMGRIHLWKKISMFRFHQNVAIYYKTYGYNGYNRPSEDLREGAERVT